MRHFYSIFNIYLLSFWTILCHFVKRLRIKFPPHKCSWRIQLFRERLSAKMCTRQSRKVIWDMINTLFQTLWVSKRLLLLSFSTRKHTSMASSAILSNFFEEHRTQNHLQYLSGLSRALFPTTSLEVAVFIEHIIKLWIFYLISTRKKSLSRTLLLWGQNIR